MAVVYQNAGLFTIAIFALRERSETPWSKTTHDTIICKQSGGFHSLSSQCRNL